MSVNMSRKLRVARLQLVSVEVSVVLQGRAQLQALACSGNTNVAQVHFLRVQIVNPLPTVLPHLDDGLEVLTQPYVIEGLWAVVNTRSVGAGYEVSHMPGLP